MILWSRWAEKNGFSFCEFRHLELEVSEEEKIEEIYVLFIYFLRFLNLDIYIQHINYFYNIQLGVSQMKS